MIKPQFKDLEKLEFLGLEDPSILCMILGSGGKSLFVRAGHPKILLLNENNLKLNFKCKYNCNANRNGSELHCI